MQTSSVTTFGTLLCCHVLILCVQTVTLISFASSRFVPLEAMWVWGSGLMCYLVADVYLFESTLILLCFRRGCELLTALLLLLMLVIVEGGTLIGIGT